MVRDLLCILHWRERLHERQTEGSRHMVNRLGIGLLAGLALLLGHQADANPCPPGNPPSNCGPPTGSILDLNGTPVPHSYQLYTTSFTATNASTNISFAFREDPAFLGLDDVSVTTGGGPHLITNGGFEGGPLNAKAPTGWTYLNSFGATFGGVVSNTASPGPHSGSLFY